MKNEIEQLLLAKNERLWELISKYKPCDVHDAKKRAFNELEFEDVKYDCFYCELYRSDDEECLNCPFMKTGYDSDFKLKCLAEDSPFMILDYFWFDMPQEEWAVYCLQIAYMHKHKR